MLLIPLLFMVLLTNGIIFIRFIPDLCDYLLPLEEIIRRKFLPNLMGQSSFSDVERDLFSLPPTRKLNVSLELW